MNYTRQAIERAVEGGFEGNESFLLNLPEYAKCQIWLDPSFWQCLGKALNPEGLRIKNGFGETVSLESQSAWYKTTWHRFIDHLIEGKDAESFFRELLSAKK